MHEVAHTSSSRVFVTPGNGDIDILQELKVDHNIRHNRDKGKGGTLLENLRALQHVS